MKRRERRRSGIRTTLYHLFAWTFLVEYWRFSFRSFSIPLLIRSFLCVQSMYIVAFIPQSPLSLLVWLSDWIVVMPRSLSLIFDRPCPVFTDPFLFRRLISNVLFSHCLVVCFSILAIIDCIKCGSTVIVDHVSFCKRRTVQWYRTEEFECTVCPTFVNI